MMKSKEYTFCDYLKENLSSNFRVGFVILAVLVLWMVSVSFRAEGSSKPEYKYYKSVEITAGDTLWTIAENYMDEHYGNVREYIDEVETINGISAENITAGKSIVIPYYSNERH